jgi:hypothetical protein
MGQVGGGNEQTGPDEHAHKGPFIMITAAITGLSPSSLQYPSPGLEANHSFNHNCKTDLLSWMVEILWPR